MTDIDFLRDRVRDYEESVRFFGNEGKRERELFIARVFLRNLGVPVQDHELESVPDDPPDVRVRRLGAEFECKERPDDARRRHDEYKAKLDRARAMLAACQSGWKVDLTPLCEEWRQEAMSVLEAVQYTVQQSCLEVSKANAYAPAVRANVDLLVYVNLIDRVAVPDSDICDESGVAAHGWRSVSFLANQCAGVLHAGHAAPNFLARNVGRLAYRSLSK